jgi:hypothetical protein
MVIGKKQGIGIIIFGLLLLTAGILVLVTMPSWGSWIADYPTMAAQLVTEQAPPQAAPVAQAVLGFVMGPLIHQVGEYMKTAGYFVGSLLSLVALVVTTAGTTIAAKRA